MKKTIRPPENWQDFETLCKKLFGEIWKCSLTIKKNGRLGQSQSGVDIYGKPINENNYWGIQCKGKDNYLDTKLTEGEIEEEIEKAQVFEPKLEMFIIASTCPKDVKIEKFVRIKDQENCSIGSFGIVLYCWQDIADLIEENRDTYNWYVNEVQFRDKFDVDIDFWSKNNDETLQPKFKKKIINNVLETPILKIANEKQKIYDQIILSSLNITPTGLLGPKYINHGWVKINVSIKNSGGIVLEDWKCWIEFFDNTRKVDDDFDSNILTYKQAAKYRTTWAYEDKKRVLYEPLNNSPLIQKDSVRFSCFCIPHYDAEIIKIRWHVLARDFDRIGEFSFKVKPEYVEEKVTLLVYCEEEVGNETKIEDYITN